MSDDIGDILQRWRYEPDKNVRIITGDDGREKIQVRLPVGIEQYEMDGRPDGRRFGEYGSLRQLHLARLRVWQEEHGSDEGFRLDPDACSELRQESVLYYYRYVLLFQLADYDRTIRDVERNRSLFDFVKKYAVDACDVVALEQYRPYVIRMSRVASALKSAEDGEVDRAVAFAETGLREIEELGEIDDDVFRFEKQRSLDFLREVRDDLLRQRPASPVEEIRRGIERAVAEEDYERAAELRDIMKELEHLDGGGHGG